MTEKINKINQQKKIKQLNKNEKLNENKKSKEDGQLRKSEKSKEDGQLNETKKVEEKEQLNKSKKEQESKQLNEVEKSKTDLKNKDEEYKNLQIEETKNPMNKWWCDALVFIGGTIALGFVAKLLGGKMFDFNNYEMPPATAPSNIFPFIWIVIYIAIGISTYLMWRDKEISKKDRAINLVLYIVQMIFNVLWPWFFFRCDLPVFAVFWLIALIGVSFACMYRFFICNLPAGIIFNIYSLWLIYALYLNLGLVLINFVTI